MVSVSVELFGRPVLWVHLNWGTVTADQPPPAAPGPAEPERTIGFFGGAMLHAERAEPLYGDGMDTPP
jgi:hypothetical protein